MDKHRAELVYKVRNIGTIMDELLGKKVVSDEIYAEGSSTVVLSKLKNAKTSSLRSLRKMSHMSLQSSRKRSEC